jgi:hypothetical protein
MTNDKFSMTNFQFRLTRLVGPLPRCLFASSRLRALALKPCGLNCLIMRLAAFAKAFILYAIDSATRRPNKDRRSSGTAGWKMKNENDKRQTKIERTLIWQHQESKKY